MLMKPDGEQPVALARQNRFTVALPTAADENLFEPPNYTKPAADRASLVRLCQDIGMALGMADTIIALDSGLRSSDTLRKLQPTAIQT